MGRSHHAPGTLWQGNRHRTGRHTEITLDSERGLAWCPTLWWFAKGASFAVIKTGDKSYRPIFSYHPETQIGTGVVDVLQVEADHMRRQKLKLEELAAKA